MKAFRSFAPSVLREDVADWFELECDSPYMLLVAGVAAGHRWEMTDEEKGRFGIDGLHYFARIQTVHQETNPRYYDLIAAFKARTGCPVIVNTSFNIRGEPIVCTPEDAFRCFMGTEIDSLAISNCFLRKEEQDPELKRDYQAAFEPD
jgi:carbamoyltransferase